VTGANNLSRRAAPLSAPILEGNAILCGLDEPSVTRIVANGKLVRLALREKVYDSEEPIQTVYFPLECVLSIVTNMKDGGQIEVGTIGREGMSAFPLLLGHEVPQTIVIAKCPDSR